MLLCNSCGMECDESRSLKKAINKGQTRITCPSCIALIKKRVEAEKNKKSPKTPSKTHVKDNSSYSYSNECYEDQSYLRQEGYLK